MTGMFLGASASIGLHADLGGSTAIVANFTPLAPRAGARGALQLRSAPGKLRGGQPGSRGGDDARPRREPAAASGDACRARPTSTCTTSPTIIFGDLTDRIANNLRVLDIRQGDSRFVGFDARGSFWLGGQVWATLGLGYVNATLTTTGEPLPRIPPLRGTLSLEIPGPRVDDQPGTALRGAAGPNLPRRDRDGRLLGGQRRRVLHLAPGSTWRTSCRSRGYNLANALYRNHTSFIKDLAPEMGRGVRVGYSLRFF